MLCAQPPKRVHLLHSTILMSHAASIRFQICPPPTHPPRSWFLRRHGDEMERLPGGYYRAHGRVDDTSERSSASHCHSAPALPLPSCRCWNVPKAFQILTLK